MADGYAPDANNGGAPSERKPPDLARLKRYVSEAQSLTSQARLESLIDVDYYDGHQLTPAEKAALAERGQPDIIINRTRAAVNGILGVTEQGKSDPRAFPRTPADEDSADVVTDSLRYIADFNRFPRIKQDCFLDMLVPGTMAVLVGADADLKVTIEQIRWEEFIYDPKSRRKDFAEARYKGIAKWMYADDVSALYPEKAGEIDGAVNDGSIIGDVSFQDRPDHAQQAWVDRRNRRLLVIELYYREQGWERCVFHAGGILEEGPSPYQDDKGKPICPIEAESAYVDRNNNRYGAVRDMRGPQDEINKRRSKLLHLVNASQIQEVSPGSGMGDVDAARREAARPDGVIPPGWEKVPTTDMTSGQAQLLAEAKGELERLGPNPAILGRQGADQSGRALLARQQAGLVELALLFGCLEDWELRVYRQCWMRAKQFWRAPMFIRVTDDEDAPKFVGLNVPRGAPVMDENGQPAVDPKTGQPMEGEPMVHPSLGSVFGYKNVIAELDADITLDTQPNTATVQQEQFDTLAKIVASNPAYAQEVPFSVMVELSSVPNKRRLRDMLKGQQDPQMAAMQEQMQQVTQRLQLMEVQAKIKESQTKSDLNSANADLATARANALTSGALLDAHQAGMDAAHQPIEHAASILQAHDSLLTGQHQRDLAQQQADQPAAGD